MRGTGAYCQAAAPTVTTLQGEMGGRALLLEYAFDTFNQGRVDRWSAAYTGSATVYLPLVMVGSGLQIEQGPVDYDRRYRAMLDAELARPPAASLLAWSRRIGDGLRLYARATNLTAAAITPQRQAAFWVVVWEDAQIGLTQTWVRATVSQPLPVALEPGATTTATIDVPPLTGVNWQRLRALALLEHRPGGVSGPYDMLQAAIAAPATVAVTPSRLWLGPSLPSAEISIDGPDALRWTATPEVQWLLATPVSGAMPAKCVVSLVGTPAVGQTGTVRLDATGDGMSVSATVTVTTQGRLMRIRRHLSRIGGSGS